MVREKEHLSKPGWRPEYPRLTVALLLILGLILGPLYYAYCLLFSGEKVQTIEMAQRATTRWIDADGSILRFTNGMAYKPVLLALKPEMNRITLRLHFTFGSDTVATPAERLNYQVSLAEFDHTILQRTIQVRPDRSRTQTVDIGPIEIPYPAEYRFVLSEAGELRQAPSLTLDVLQKVQTPVRSIIWAGIGLLIAALIFRLVDKARTAARHHPD